jgi:uncharacterized membrane protein
MGKTSMGLDAKTAGLLCYVAGWISGIVFFILEKENKFVRFHALQSIIVFGILSAASGVFRVVPIIGDFLNAGLYVLLLVLWIVLMVKASKGEKFKVWWADDFAEKQVG